MQVLCAIVLFYAELSSAFPNAVQSGVPPFAKAALGTAPLEPKLGLIGPPPGRLAHLALVLIKAIISWGLVVCLRWPSQVDVMKKSKDPPKRSLDGAPL